MTSESVKLPPDVIGRKVPEYHTTFSMNLYQFTAVLSTLYSGYEKIPCPQCPDI